jgi:hypothetical protein
MEQKTIPLNKGIVRNTSLATDGELIDCVNLMPKNGQMMNAPTLTETGETSGRWETLLYIHPMSVGDVYVVKYTNEGDIIIAYKKEGSNVEICTVPPYAELYEVKHIGNVLVVLTSERTAMFLYNNGEYIDYTFDFDDIDIEFGLNGHLVRESSDTQLAFVESSDDDAIFTDVAIANGEINLYTTINDLQYCAEIAVKLKKGYSYKLKVNKIAGKSNSIRYTTYVRMSDGTLKRKVNEKTNHDFSYFKCEEDNVVGLVLDNDLIPTVASYTLWESVSEDGWRIKDEDINTVLGEVNSYIANRLDENKFMFPFFVRYAIELMDGSYIRPSAPCLMIPTTGVAPQVHLSETFDYKEQNREIYVCAFVGNLAYRIKGALDELKKRDKLIKGIAIAVSSPIYRYNQGITDEEIKKKYLRLQPFGVIKNDTTIALDEEIDAEKYLSISKKDLYIKYGIVLTNETDTIDTIDTKMMNVSLPVFGNMSEQIENASTFRIIHRIDLQDLEAKEKFTEIELEDGVLKGLAGRAILTDDVSSLNRTLGKTSYVYNSRLNISNYKEVSPKGYKPTLCNGWKDAFYDGKDLKETSDFSLTCRIYNELGTKEAKVLDVSTGNSAIYWLYTPFAKTDNATLYKIINGERTDGTKYRHGYSKEIEMKSHPFLNGSYWFDDFKPLTLQSVGEVTAYMNDEYGYIVDGDNKIKTSEVNNPFVMKQTTSLNDDIVALATTTKAISEGQFGQFPLYAFCNDGIWALEPSSDGTYASKQPVSRDVCSNPKAITQTDNAVVFPTLQGLKVLQGGTTTNISNVMDGKAEDISFLEDVIAEFNGLCLTDNADFNEAIQDANIVYDYVNNLLHIYTEKASYIYNLSSGDWTRTDDQKPTAIVPGYPYSTIQVGTKLYRYEKPTADGTRKGMLLTRETAFDDPLTMKIIKDLRVMRRHGDAKVAVWASNDRKNWVRMRSLRMASYKWYRFAVFTKLNNTDALEGIVARTESRKTNKMR